MNLSLLFFWVLWSHCWLVKKALPFKMVLKDEQAHPEVHLPWVFGCFVLFLFFFASISVYPRVTQDFSHFAPYLGNGVGALLPTP